MLEPNGSSMTAPRPPATNFAGMPSTVSEPNQVANVVVTIITSGRWRPATAKSDVVLTRFATHRPIAIVASRYARTNAISMQAVGAEGTTQAGSARRQPERIDCAAFF